MDEFLLSDAVLRRFLDVLKDYAIIILDIDGKVVSWNAGAQAIKGYDAAEIIGQNVALFYTPEAQRVGHPERELSAAAVTGRYEEEGWRVRKDGTRFWAHVIITAIMDDDGELRGFGKVTRDLTQRKQAEEQMQNVISLLETTARTDFLTGLDNRRSLDAALAASLSAAKRHSRPLSVAMIDLDKFKAFNDSHGHRNGDRYLKRAVLAWRGKLRGEDVLARYGGEEFCVVMPDIGLPDATNSMERLRQATPPPITCSIGVAQWDGYEAADLLIGRADRALYQAKEAGRNRVEAAADQANIVQPFPQIGRKTPGNGV
jgi:diguanylate cyclase (GGDEF)-like protein/PAS domain S-box-containing protein